MSNIVIKKTITVSGDNMKRVTIPDDHIKEEGGSLFLHASNVPNYMSALLLSDIKDRRGGRMERWMARTDVIGQLVGARNHQIHVLMTKEAKAVEQMTLFDEGPSRKRIKIDDKVDMPTTAVIDAPTIGDVKGIPMKVMMSWKKTAPLYVELTVDVISYMRSACKWQIDHGCIHRGRDQKKPSEEAPIDNKGHADIESISDDETDSERADAHGSHALVPDTEVKEELCVDGSPEATLDEQSFEAALAACHWSDDGEAAPTPSSSSSSGLSSGTADMRVASRPNDGSECRSSKITSYFAKRAM